MEETTAIQDSKQRPGPTLLTSVAQHKEKAVAEPRPSPLLDVDAFRHFAPLLEACQAYAHRSGCRFRRSDFKNDRSPRQDCLKSLPVVLEFSDRLRDGNEALMAEIECAFRVVMVESVRNAMVGTCQRLEMWPPRAPLVEIDSSDCSYEDLSAPLPVVAQRLHNDEQRRQAVDAELPRIKQRVMTAAFLVDFAQEAGAVLPDMPETQLSMLKEFGKQVDLWEEAKPRRKHITVLSVWRAAEKQIVAFENAHTNWQTTFTKDLHLAATSIASHKLLAGMAFQKALQAAAAKWMEEETMAAAKPTSKY
eukprot:CAMPEP_0197661848 /NCGR_PEP_ID=MMETSP1338-20131121/51704_1 /TAXON_ID=43686 ORGANISM="Pelagodinium beii, Strain RCC1491" /NCGR_SAMPLE_ID=MMETSP1338 /ASSEMBLY_ACC=CAM_ASM_000754 /LENGTH=305 /DNA_ID=CAMNT_0043239483 /DNA_START=71 /DNA_END=988 /DNA_ORIENTATION=-